MNYVPNTGHSSPHKITKLGAITKKFEINAHSCCTSCSFAKTYQTSIEIDWKRSGRTFSDPVILRCPLLL